MHAARPRLLLIGGPHVPSDAAGALAPIFNVVHVSGEAAMQALRGDSGQQFQAILADTGDYLPLERELVSQQASTLLNALGEGVCLADLDGSVLWANHRFRSYEDQTRARITTVCRQGARWLAETLAAGALGGVASRRYDVASADESRHYEVLVSPVQEGGRLGGGGGGDGGGAGGSGQAEPRTPPRHVAALVWDVTATRRAQKKQALIEAAGEELVRLDPELIRKLHTGERLRVVEEKIVRFAHDLLHFDHFAIRLLDERSGKLELVMSKDLPPEAMEVALYARRDGNGISGYVAATGRSYICADTTKDARYVIGIQSCRSSLTVPLRLHDKVIGVFNVESEQLAAFTEEDRQFAENFANHIALALHMLNLLVVERFTTGQTVTGTMEGELSEPLDDLSVLADKLKGVVGADPAAQRLVERIVADVDSIRRRVKDVASGPRNVLGAEKALSDVSIDPLLKDRRILVVDDEPRIRQVVRDVLRARGADVVVCEDGESAIAVLTTGTAPSASGPGSERTAGVSSPAGPREFDLLISDIKLPDKTGYDVFAAARKVNAKLPVILMTGFGYDPHHSIVRASQEGLSCALYKPFQAERLIEEVHKALARKPTA